MPKFLHEYNHYANGQVVENGWWEIRGNKLYNSCGGWHDYTPRPDDEIKESTWDEILKESVRDDTETTGWIAPDGVFYGCAPQAHEALAEYVIGASERELEEKGYVKIYRNPAYLRVSVPGTPLYEAAFFGSGRITKEQIATLKEKGVETRYPYVGEKA